MVGESIMRVPKFQKWKQAIETMSGSLEAFSATLFTSLEQIALFLSNTAKLYLVTENQWKYNVQGTFKKIKIVSFKTIYMYYREIRNIDYQKRKIKLLLILLPIHNYLMLCVQHREMEILLLLNGIMAIPTIVIVDTYWTFTVYQTLFEVLHPLIYPHLQYLLSPLYRWQKWGTRGITCNLLKVILLLHSRDRIHI